MSSAHRLRRAGIGGLSALVCASTALILTGVPAFAAPPIGQIGILDTDSTAVGTQGATAVTPGTSRALADVQLLVPNDYVANDTITLGLVDSVASNTNLDAASALKFSSTPTVIVGPSPLTSASKIGPTSAGTNLVADPAPAGTTAPTFTTTLKDSGRAHGQNDAVELKVGAAATGTATDYWLVTITNIKVDVGQNVFPGELRVVPVSATDFPGNTVASPVAGQYTVGGYVMPASISVGNPSGITADGTAQQVGDITVSELVNRGLQGTTYTVTVPASVTVENDAANKVTATVTGPANGETVTNVTATNGGHTVTFKLNQSDPASSVANVSTVTLHGLLLSSHTSTQITYTLTGGVMAASVATDPSANQTDIKGPGVPQATGTSVTTGNRISGADRYATAAQVAMANGGGGTVVLASGEAFPDALSAGFLSQRLGGVSVLLTQANTLPTATASALQSLHTTKVYVVGGPVAISQGVVDAVKAITDDNASPAPSQVTRLSGADRYATNKAVNNEALNHGVGGVGTTHITFGQAAKKTALLATGENFADALAATPATAGNGNGALPLILTQSGTLSQAAKDQLTADGIEQVVIAGGVTAVSPGVESALTGMGIAVKRIAGATRYETATDLAEFEMDGATPTSASDPGGLGFNPTADQAYLATGEAFADALAGGPLAANQESPILLTTGTSLASATGAFLVAHKADFDGVTALGGPVAIANAVVQAANTDVIG